MGHCPASQSVVQKCTNLTETFTFNLEATDQEDVQAVGLTEVPLSLIACVPKLSEKCAKWLRTSQQFLRACGSEGSGSEGSGRDNLLSQQDPCQLQGRNGYKT